MTTTYGNQEFEDNKPDNRDLPNQVDHDTNRYEPSPYTPTPDPNAYMTNPNSYEQPNPNNYTLDPNGYPVNPYGYVPNPNTYAPNPPTPYYYAPDPNSYGPPQNGYYPSPNVNNPYYQQQQWQNGYNQSVLGPGPRHDDFFLPSILGVLLFPPLGVGFAVATLMRISSKKTPYHGHDKRNAIAVIVFGTLIFLPWVGGIIQGINDASVIAV